MGLMGYSWTTVIFTGLISYLCVILLRKYLRFRRTVTVLCKLPGMETEFLFGNSRQMPDFCEKGLKWMRDNCKLRPKISVGWMGPVMGMVNIVHPDTVKVILKSSAPKSRNIYALVLPWLGEGLLISNGEKWFRSRRLLTPAFHFDILKQYLVVQNKASDVLVNKIQQYAADDVYFEVFSDVCLFSLDVILQSAFSFQSNCQVAGRDQPYIKAVADLNDLLTKRFFKFWLYPDILYYLTPNGRKWKRACDLVHKVAEDIIEERRQKLLEDIEGTKKAQDFQEGTSKVHDVQEGTSKVPDLQEETSKAHDFLGILLTAKDDEGVGLTPMEIRNEVDTFLFEGHDTTTSGTSWCLYAIAKYPHIQRKLHQEIDTLLHGRENDHIQWDDLSKMPYLTCVIKESLRINPPVTFIQRVTNEPLTLEGYEIPVGSYMNIVLYNALNNPTVWDDPDEFQPERFTQENSEKRDPFCYVPFSAGPRNCIGQNFAMNEMKTVIARILQRFTLELDPNHVVERQLGAVLRSKNGIRMKAIPRTPA